MNHRRQQAGEPRADLADISGKHMVTLGTCMEGITSLAATPRLESYGPMTKKLFLAQSGGTSLILAAITRLRVGILSLSQYMSHTSL